MLETCLDFYKKSSENNKKLDNLNNLKSYYLLYKEILEEETIYNDLVEITVDCTYKFVENFIGFLYVNNKDSENKFVTQKEFSNEQTQIQNQQNNNNKQKIEKRQVNNEMGLFLKESLKFYPKFNRKTNKEKIKLSLNKNDFEVFETYINEWYYYIQVILDSDQLDYISPEVLSKLNS